MSRTQGWAAGLRMAAMSLAHRADREEAARRFAGDTGTVAEYLLAEVLNTQPDGVRQLLLDTSVVDVLRPGLASALAGPHAERALSFLVHGNAFLEELPEFPGCYRYHDLFRELLRAQLAYESPGSCGRAAPGGRRLARRARRRARACTLRQWRDGLQPAECGRRAKARRSTGQDRVRRALLAGFPDRVAMRREPGSLRLLLSSGTGAVLAKDSGMHGGEFLVALDVSGGRKRSCASPASSSASGSRRRTKTSSTPCERRQSARDEARLVRRAAPQGDQRRARSAEVARLTPKREAARISTPRRSFAAPTRRCSGPERLDLPSGRSVKLEYREDGSVFASVKLQELFGLADTPRIGSNARHLRAALARRPPRAGHARPALVLERRVSGSAQGAARAVSEASVAGGSVDGAGRRIGRRRSNVGASASAADPRRRAGLETGRPRPPTT